MKHDLETTALPTQPLKPKFQLISHRTLHYVIMLCAMVILAGHEKTNPKIGHSYIDFYQQQCQKLIEIQSATLISKDTNEKSAINSTIEILVSQFYNLRNFKPVWTINFKTTENYKTLTEILDSAKYFGFPDNFFHAEQIKLLQKEFTESAKTNNLKKRIELEIACSKEMFHLLISLNKGIIQTDTTSTFQNFVRHLPTMVNNALENGKFSDVVNDIQPNLIIYRSLLTSIPSFQNLHTIIDNSSASALNEQQIAQIMNYAEILSVPHFDSVNTCESVLLKFQHIYNLPADGTFNKPTHLQIQKIFDYRTYQICLNLDRLRKINSSEDSYLFINIPEYKLHLIENNIETEVYNVIVGNEKTPTPVLSSRIDKIITNPCWTVPRSIAENEMISKIKKDSTYLKRNGYIIVTGKEKPVDISSIDWNSKNPLGGDLWIRQLNQKDNALGNIKFLFPNEHQVYLHDTPGKHLFKKEKRAFSHGCIRLQNPQELAQKLADKYNKQTNAHVNIEILLKKNSSSVIELEKAFEIHICYLTCEADSDGTILFLDDIYKLDETEINALFRSRQAI
jgi:murein L,D-transpeptidase YcbB/YkuD